MNDVRACMLGCSNADGYPYPAAPGLLVCHRCSDKLRLVLDHIEQTYAAVTAVDELIPGGHGNTGIRRPPGPRSPAVDGILVHTDTRSAWDGQPAALAEVAGYARLVREDRSIDVPPDRMLATVPAGRVTMARELETLRFHWDWIMGQEWVDEFAAQMRAVLQALRTIQDRQPGTVRIGKCAVTVAVLTLANGLDLDFPCGATLRVKPADDEIRCPNCHTIWPRNRWHELGDDVMDFARLSVSLNVPVGTLRRWAMEDAWVRAGTRGRPLLRVEDARASYARRRGTLPLGEATA